MERLSSEMYGVYNAIDMSMQSQLLAEFKI